MVLKWWRGAVSASRPGEVRLSPRDSNCASEWRVREGTAPSWEETIPHPSASRVRNGAYSRSFAGLRCAMATNQELHASDLGLLKALSAMARTPPRRRCATLPPALHAPLSASSGTEPRRDRPRGCREGRPLRRCPRCRAACSLRRRRSCRGVRRCPQGS